MAAHDVDDQLVTALCRAAEPEPSPLTSGPVNVSRIPGWVGEGRA